jgi:hypothetical protein
MTVRVVPPVAILLSLFFTQDTYLPVLTAQTTTTVTKTVKNPDGPYTIIEYPAKKEVIVNLQPTRMLPDATGHAKILRDDDRTRVDISVTVAEQRRTEVLEKKGARYRGWRISKNEFKTCIEAVILIEGGSITKTNESCRGTIIAAQDDPAVLNVYAVDERGKITALGPLAIDNGVGEMRATTPLTRFMLVLSPEQALTSYDRTTRAALRSTVPEGFAVVPFANAPSGDQVAAVPAQGPWYYAPQLYIRSFKKGDDTKLRSDFSGALTGARANVFITPREDGPTEIRFRFHDVKEAPAGKSFILWAVSPDNEFVRLGQIVTVPGRNEVEIRAETTLPNFGLLITMENESVIPIETPKGPTVGTFRVVR